jgi:Flp pilus assembly protein TadD
MDQRSKKKARQGEDIAVPLIAPASPAGEMPGVAGSLLLESESRPAGLNDRWLVPGVCIFLAAIVWVVFGQTLRYEFVNYDDNLYVYENPTVAHGLSLEGVEWAFTHTVVANWHPLTMMSHMLDCQLYGLQACGHHLTNVLLHTASVILLFLVLRQMTGVLWCSAFVAAVFAIHPLRVESVAWVAERKDVLSGVFFMLTIGAYVRYARRPWSPAHYGLVVLLFALGLMCKPMLVTLPLVLLLLDYWPLNRFAPPTPAPAVTGKGDLLKNHSVPWRLVIEKIPLLALSGAACVVTTVSQKDIIVPVPLASRIGNAAVSYVVYLRQMLCPSGLAVLYPFTANGVGVSEVVLSLVLLAGISAGVFVLRRRRPYFLTGWLWYLIMLAPVIGIVQVGAQAHADRYTYLPQISLYLLLTWGAAELCAGWRHRRWMLSGLTTIILMALIFCARTQTSYWRNGEWLWTHTLACTSDNYVAHYSLGDALLQKGSVDEAITHFQTALQINPNYAEAHNYLGNILLQNGRVDEAIAHYQKALQITPDYVYACYDLGNALLKKGRVDEAITQYQKALQINPDHAEAHNNLGNALLQKGRVAEAITQYQKALQIKPDYAVVHDNLGNVLLQKGNVDEAITQYQKALQIKPDYAEAHNNLGNALLQKGRMAEATTQYQKALQIKPDYAEAHNNLAWVLATAPQASLRNGGEAVELAQRANQLTGGENPVILHTLAAAYAEVGRFSDARRSAQKAIEWAQAAGRKDLAEQFNGELKLYEAGLPFHQESK